MTTTLSPYRIYWVEIRAIKGIVTKHDKKLLNDLDSDLFRVSKFHVHFSSLKKAQAWLKNDWSMLDKQYECRICTDKQFGMMVNDEIPFTTKQNNEVYHIGK